MNRIKLIVAFEVARIIAISIMGIIGVIAFTLSAFSRGIDECIIILATILMIYLLSTLISVDIDCTKRRIVRKVWNK